MKKMMLLLVFLLCGCSQLQKLNISDQHVLTKEQLNTLGESSEDLYNYHLSSKTIDNLKETDTKLTELTGIQYEYVILNTDGYSYGAISKDGKNYVGLSTDFLNTFGDDPDVVMSATLHVLAHIKQGTTDTNNEKREVSLFLIRQIVSTTVSFFATPIAGYASSFAISGAESGAKIKEENDANTLTMEWLKTGNLNPCGFIKEKKHSEQNSAITDPKKLLFMHSGVNDRAKLAKEYLDINPELICE